MRIKLTIILFMAVLLGYGGSSSFAQESTTSAKSQKKLEKEQKKKEKELQAAKDREQLTNLLKNKFFVFKASRLQGPQGQSFSVPPDRNFLIVNDTLILYQFAFDNIVGWNGVGGATMEGYITNYTFNDGGAKKPLTVSSRITPKIGQGNSRFSITVRDSGDGNMELMLGDGTRLMLVGNIVNPPDSGINVGRTW